jgi:YVTN family beta-propeller protein
MTQRWMRRGLVAAALVAASCSSALAQGTRAYVANRGASTVTVVDVVTAAVIDTIALEAPPHDVVLAHGRV